MGSFEAEELGERQGRPNWWGTWEAGEAEVMPAYEGRWDQLGAPGRWAEATRKAIIWLENMKVTLKSDNEAKAIASK